MLVITRRIGEAFLIETPSGEMVEITILDTQGNRVRIGAAASKDITITREEALDQDHCSLQQPSLVKPEHLDA